MFKSFLFNIVTWIVLWISCAPVSTLAHGTEDHSSTSDSLSANTGGHGTGAGVGHAGMTPFFHFHSGDFFYFEGWQLSNGGIIFAACAAVFVIAVFERLAVAGRAIIERRLRARVEPSRLVISSTPSKEVSVHRNGDIPPFMITHELTRGGFYMLQAFLMYLLMLAVMTYHAAIILAILLGAGVGEMLFGRFALSAAPH